MPKALSKSGKLALLLIGSQLLVASASAYTSHKSPAPLQKPNLTHAPNPAIASAYNFDRWLWNKDTSWGNDDGELFSKTQLKNAYTPLSAEEIQRRLSIPKS